MSGWDDFMDALDRFKRKYEEGDCVELRDGGRGKIRYIGAKRNRDGVWVGVELERRGDGDSDGTFDGVEYFRAADRTAVLVRVRDVERRLNRELRKTHLEKRVRPYVDQKEMRQWFRKGGGRRERMSRDVSYDDYGRGGRGRDRERNRRHSLSRDEDLSNDTYRTSRKHKNQLEDFREECLDIVKKEMGRNRIKVGSNRRLEEAGAIQLIAYFRGTDSRDVNYKDRAVTLLIQRKQQQVEDMLLKATTDELETLQAHRKARRYDEMDDKGRESVSRKDFHKKLKDQGIILTNENAMDVFDKLDSNGDGYISYNEFSKHCPSSGDIFSNIDRLLLKMFQKSRSLGRAADTIKDHVDGNDKIYPKELRRELDDVDIRISHDDAEDLYNEIKDMSDRHARRRGSRSRDYIYWPELARRIPTQKRPRDIRLGDLLIGDFQKMDSNMDGEISFKEFFKYLRDKCRDKIESREAEEIFDYIDENKDGVITMREYYKVVPKSSDLANHVALLLNKIHKYKSDRFRRIDRNNSMNISFDEFDDYIQEKGMRLSKRQVEKVFNFIDTNGDGFIELKEFFEAVPADKDFTRWVEDTAYSSSSDRHRSNRHRLDHAAKEDEFLRNPAVWGADEVRDWIATLKDLERKEVQKVEREFQKQDVDGETLLALTADDLSFDFRLGNYICDVLDKGIRKLKRQKKDDEKRDGGRRGRRGDDSDEDPSRWTAREVEKWLEKKLHLTGRQLDRFARKKVDGRELKELKERDLERDFGIYDYKLKDDFIEERDKLFDSRGRRGRDERGGGGRDRGREKGGPDPRDVKKWDERDVQDWAKAHRFDHLAFKRIDGRDLLKLRSYDLQDKGVPRRDREDVMEEIRKLKRETGQDGGEVDVVEFTEKVRRMFRDVGRRECDQIFGDIDAAAGGRGSGRINWRGFQREVLDHCRDSADLASNVRQYVKDQRRKGDGGRGGRDSELEPRRSRSTRNRGYEGDPEDWGRSDVITWLKDAGFRRWVDAFQDARVDGAKLRSFTKWGLLQSTIREPRGTTDRDLFKLEDEIGMLFSKDSGPSGGRDSERRGGGRDRDRDRDRDRRDRYEVSERAARGDRRRRRDRSYAAW